MSKVKEVLHQASPMLMQVPGHMSGMSIRELMELHGDRGAEGASIQERLDHQQALRIISERKIRLLQNV